MKYIYSISILFLLTILSLNCRAQQKINKKKIEFDYPENIEPDKKKAFAEQVVNGRILYSVHCAKCHSKTEAGKEIIPDFSLPQLLDYEMRFQYPEHQDPLRDEALTKEELDVILIFLQYKKKNVAAK